MSWEKKCDFEWESSSERSKEMNQVFKAGRENALFILDRIQDFQSIICHDNNKEIYELPRCPGFDPGLLLSLSIE